MQKVFLGAIALIAFGANAGAADLPLKAWSPDAPYDWTGFYIGGHAGWESADTSGFTNNNLFALASSGTALTPLLPDNSSTDQTMHGWVAGGQLGYNHQFGRAVVGLEFSGSWSKLSSQTAGTVSGELSPGVPGFTTGLPLGCSQQVNVLGLGATGFSSSVSCNAEVDWAVQALTRLGYTFADGRFLPYIEGGVALAHLSVATSIGVNTPVGPETDTFGKSSELVGVVLGGGAQYALGNGFSVGIEYLYARYPTEDFSGIGTFNCAVPAALACFLGVPPGPLTSTHTVQENHDLTTNTVRVVLNYKLGN
ncbi:MAG TPA: outer membrane beta-barrel protein [Xanthobacteraceae bacterium]|nr:outer membrane beta-barrel protein [Xanthobacteraceae bacterium]